MFEIEEYIKLTEIDYSKARSIVETSEFWRELLRMHPDLKFEVSLNKFLPDDIIKNFAEDDDDNIRLTVAMKRRISPEVFDLLSSDENESVRLAVAGNPKTPRYILDKMKDDSWEEIRNTVISRLA